MNPSVRRWMGVGRAVLGAGLLVYVVVASGALATARRVLETPWLLPVIALVIPVLGMAIESMRLRALFTASGYDLPFVRAFRLVAVSALLGYAVPGGTGADVVRLYYLATEHRGRTVEMAAILLVDRLAALGALMVVVLLIGAVEGRILFDTAVGRSLALLSLGVLGAQILLTALAWSNWVRATRLYRWVTTDAPGAPVVARLAASLHRFGEHRGAVLAALAWSATGHTLTAALFGATGYVMFGPSAVLTAVVLSLFGMLANALPLTPGGLGVGEAAFDRLFAVAGLTGGAGMLLVWRVATVPVALLGFVFYVTARGAIATARATSEIGEGAR